MQIQKTLLLVVVCCFEISTGLQDDVVQAAQREFVPPLAMMRESRFLLYTEFREVKYTVKSVETADSQFERNSIEKLKKESNNPQIETNSIEKLRTELAVAQAKWALSSRKNLWEKEIQSPLLTIEAYERLKTECLAHNLPIENHRVVKEFLEGDLILINQNLTSSGLEMLPEMLDPNWYVKNGLTKCKVGTRASFLTWSIWVFLKPIALKLKSIRVVPVKFRYYDTICKSSVPAHNLAVSFDNQTSFMIEETRSVENDSILAKIQKFDEISRDHLCVTAVLQNDIQLTRQHCQLVCTNEVISSTSRVDDFVIVSTLKSEADYNCFKQKTEKWKIPDLGSIKVGLKYQCKLDLKTGESMVYPTEREFNETIVKIILPNTWMKANSNQSCIDWRKCLEAGILTDETPIATSGVGQIPKLMNRDNRKISFTFGEGRKDSCVEGGNLKAEVQSLRDQCIWVMVAQMIFLFLTVTVIIAYAKYHACNVVLILAMLIQGISGLGDVQIGPESVFPESPRVFKNISQEKLEIMFFCIVALVTCGIALGLCCCFMQCGRKKCGIMA